MDSRPGDEMLLAAVAERDIGAFRALYERHAGWLAIRLARRCNDRDLVADAIQDTFVAVWQRPQGFRGDGDIAAWLWGIAIRRLVSRLRTRSSVAAVFENPGAAPAAEDQVLLSVEYGDIGQALARLSPEMRAIIQAVVLDGLSAREAARPGSRVLGRGVAGIRKSFTQGGSTRQSSSQPGSMRDLAIVVLRLLL
jgi:RNA polymerase sigma factor (sigma-70 family)